jgi:hypothetical protein
MLPDDLIQRTTVTVLESVGRTEIKAVRSMEMRGIISTSSSEATNSSSGGVMEFRKETGNAIACKAANAALLVGRQMIRSILWAT